MARPCPYCEKKVPGSAIFLAISIGKPIYCGECKMRVYLKSPSIFSFLVSRSSGAFVAAPLVIVTFVYGTVAPLIVGAILMLGIEFFYRYSAGFIDESENS